MRFIVVWLLYFFILATAGSVSYNFSSLEGFTELWEPNIEHKLCAAAEIGQESLQFHSGVWSRSRSIGTLYCPGMGTCAASKSSGSIGALLDEARATGVFVVQLWLTLEPQVRREAQIWAAISQDPGTIVTPCSQSAPVSIIQTDNAISFMMAAVSSGTRRCQVVRLDNLEYHRLYNIHITSILSGPLLTSRIYLDGVLSSQSTTPASTFLDTNAPQFAFTLGGTSSPILAGWVGNIHWITIGSTFSPSEVARVQALPPKPLPPRAFVQHLHLEPGKPFILNVSGLFESHVPFDVIAEELTPEVDQCIIVKVLEGLPTALTKVEVVVHPGAACALGALPLKFKASLQTHGSSSYSTLLLHSLDRRKPVALTTTQEVTTWVPVPLSSIIVISTGVPASPLLAVVIYSMPNNGTLCFPNKTRINEEMLPLTLAWESFPDITYEFLPQSLGHVAPSGRVIANDTFLVAVVNANGFTSSNVSYQVSILNWMQGGDIVLQTIKNTQLEIRALSLAPETMRVFANDLDLVIISLPQAGTLRAGSRILLASDLPFRTNLSVAFLPPVDLWSPVGVSVTDLEALLLHKTTNIFSATATKIALEVHRLNVPPVLQIKAPNQHAKIGEWQPLDVVFLDFDDTFSNHSVYTILVTLNSTMATLRILDYAQTYTTHLQLGPSRILFSTTRNFVEEVLRRIQYRSLEDGVLRLTIDCIDNDRTASPLSHAVTNTTVHINYSPTERPMKQQLTVIELLAASNGLLILVCGVPAILLLVALFATVRHCQYRQAETGDSPSAVCERSTRLSSPAKAAPHSSPTSTSQPSADAEWVQATATFSTRGDLSMLPRQTTTAVAAWNSMRESGPTTSIRAEAGTSQGLPLYPKVQGSRALQLIERIESRDSGSRRITTPHGAAWASMATPPTYHTAARPLAKASAQSFPIRRAEPVQRSLNVDTSSQTVSRYHNFHTQLTALENAAASRHTASTGTDYTQGHVYGHNDTSYMT